MSKENTIVMTKGNPYKLILQFAMPLMLGNIFQQMYTLVDTMVVGKGVGVDALAAVGSSDWLNWMSLGILAGLVLHLPAFWIYFFLKIDQVLKMVWCVIRLRSGKWIKKIKSEKELA